MAETTIDVPELARRLHCGRSAAYALAASGLLPTVRVGRALRLVESGVDAFIRAGGVRTIPKAGPTDAPRVPRARAAK